MTRSNPLQVAVSWRSKTEMTEFRTWCRHSTKEARVLMAVRQDDSDRGRRGTSEGGGGGVLELL